MAIFNVVVLLFSTGAALVSAYCAYLSRKSSRRDMVDTLKLEILRLVSTIEGRKKWKDTVNKSYYKENDHIGASIEPLAGLLDSKYHEDKWVRLAFCGYTRVEK